MDKCCIFCAYGSQKCLIQQGWEQLERNRIRNDDVKPDGVKPQNFIPALGYNFLTRWYDITIRLTMPERKFRSKLIDIINPLPNERILEFGFGTGTNLQMVAAIEPDGIYFGLDVDPKVRAIAFSKLKEHHAFIDLDLYDGKIFPYDNNAFDKVYSCLVFHQLEDQVKLQCLTEIHRVLKPGGQLIIGDWGKASSRWVRTAFYAVQLLDGFKTTNANVQGRLPQFIKEAGFSHVSETGHINTRIGTFCYYEGIKIEK